MTKRNLPLALVPDDPEANTVANPKALKRWQAGLRAADDADNTISIMDIIGADWFGEGVTAKRIEGALRRIGDEDVVVNLNSPGGDFFEGLTIYNLLRNHSGFVTVNILGMAASAAAVIAMGSDETRIARSGFIMIHNTWLFGAGDRHEFRRIADWMEPFDDTTANLISERTGIKQSTIADQLDNETWIGGAKAVDQGFADDFLAADQVEAETESETAKAKRAKSAVKHFDTSCAKQRVPVSDRKNILRGIKGDMRGAVASGTHDAAFMDGISDLIETVNAI
jgi:ATP-dependent protease ClpP protease subunit